MKRLLCLLALLAIVTVLFAGMASAQRPQPTATIGEMVAVRPSPGVLKPEYQGLINASPLQPAYCSPCLFYAGDSNPSSPNANGLWDNNSSDFGISGVIYTPFVVQKQKKQHGKGWSVSGIGGNIEMSPSPPNLLGQDWSIVTGVTAGGTPASTTVLCSGTDPSPVATDTGRLFFGVFEEWNVAAHATSCPLLKLTKKGTEFWQTNPVDTGNGFFQLAYQSNTDVPPPNGFGPAQPVDQSYFYSPNFGFSTFTNANQLGSFHTFSTDIEGTVQ
jgi:hypothetical protein